MKLTLYPIVATCALLLLADRRSGASAAALPNHHGSTSSSLVKRVARCDFPGKVYNNCKYTSMTVRYDVVVNNTDTVQYTDLAPGTNSTPYTCDADFVEVKGYTLIVDDTTIGPYKNRTLEARTMADGGEYKLDAYTLECSEDFGGSDDDDDDDDHHDHDHHSHGHGHGHGHDDHHHGHKGGHNKPKGRGKGGHKSHSRGRAWETIVRCSVTYNGNMY